MANHTNAPPGAARRPERATGRIGAPGPAANMTGTLLATVNRTGDLAVNLVVNVAVNVAVGQVARDRPDAVVGPWPFRRVCRRRSPSRRAHAGLLLPGQV